MELADAAPRADPARLADLQARARAAFLGLALGDALGATVEFMNAAEIRAAHGVHRELTGGGWLRLKPGKVTDDTEMSLCLARAIERASYHARVLWCSGEWTWPVTPVTEVTRLGVAA